MDNDLDIRVFRLSNTNGMSAEITNLGARIMRLLVPVAGGRVVSGAAPQGAALRLVDVVQGFPTALDYLPERHQSDFGAVIGRYANRLAGGRITIEGQVYQLPQNNGPNCLHGGPMGWQYAVYDVLEADDRHLMLAMTSPDGDNGFPGTVRVLVAYTLTDDNRLRIDYHAESDRTTVINMTNHSYFNLSGAAGSSVLDHRLWIDADRFTPTDETAIPLADHLPVEATPMDFRTAKAVGQDIGADFGQLHIGHGYDHNYLLNTSGDVTRPCARLSCVESGISMEVYTDAPGLQLYTGNFLDGVEGKEGVHYGYRSALCLETQQYPDSPNRHWPESTGMLYAGRGFSSRTVFRFL